MGRSKIYSRKEISRILSRASEIQSSQNESATSSEGLTKEELQHVADEVGISKEILQEALLTYDIHTEKESFNWLNPNSSLQQTSMLPGNINEEKWEEIIQEIRRVTGGIGKTSKIGNSLEWEQRRKDIGYTHISLSPVQENTKLQYVSNWRGLKMMAGILSFMATFTLTAIALDGTNFGEVPALIFAVGGGLLGLPFAQIFLKSYYKKQKAQVQKVISAISRTFSQPEDSQITIEDEEVYTQSNGQTSSMTVPNKKQKPKNLS